MSSDNAPDVCKNTELLNLCYVSNINRRSHALHQVINRTVTVGVLMHTNAYEFISQIMYYPAGHLIEYSRVPARSRI